MNERINTLAIMLEIKAITANNHGETEVTIPTAVAKEISNILREQQETISYYNRRNEDMAIHGWE